MSDFLPWLAPYSGWTLMVLMALAGWLLARRGPHPKRSDGTPHCPKCDYNLTGLPENSHLCPECGLETRGVQRVGRAARWPWWIAGVFVAITLPALIVQYRVRQFGGEYYLRLYPLYAISPKKVMQERVVAGYHLQLVQDRRDYDGISANDCPTFRIRRGWNDYFVETEWHWDLKPPEAPAIRDINGDGIDDVVVTSFSGGAHCCTTLFVFELGADKPRELLELDVQHGFKGFKDFNNDGVYELETYDWQYAYWKTSYAGSPAPPIVLEWNGSAYVPSARFMKQPAPTPDEIATSATEARATIDQVDGCGELLRMMLDLIYTGHADLAYDYFDQAWPPSFPGKEEFRREFLMALGGSEFRDAIEALGHAPLPRPSEEREKPR